MCKKFNNNNDINNNDDDDDNNNNTEYQETIPEKHPVDSLQKRSAVLGTPNIIRKIL
jgi:hypothetical protein